MDASSLAIIGGGLAGCECALYLAQAGFKITLFEQKPLEMSPAHNDPNLAELVCSNSLRSNDLDSGVGLLKQEMRDLGSPLLALAEAYAVPAGKALAVDRKLFAKAITAKVQEHPKITLINRNIQGLDDPILEPFSQVVVAAGPLASDSFSSSLAKAVESEHLYFYDAIAPIVLADSIDLSIAFLGSRYAPVGEGDYLNCPLNRDEYYAFYHALQSSDRVPSHNFEKEHHFSGCMPLEAMADQGERTLTFGPLKPIGFIDPRTQRRPYAILQLRPENQERSIYNLVGCQTKLTYQAQAEVFRLIPGLGQAEFVRFGSMHRNTYVNAPKCLNNLTLIANPKFMLAGQITGVEGYVESMACGLWAGICLAHNLSNYQITPPPTTTALGALLNHLRTPHKNFQPSNIHFGLMPLPEEALKKKERKAWYTERARTDFKHWQTQELGNHA